MLQQTRTEVVRDRYEPFLEQFSDPASLASASEEAVLAAWSGLGYYRRARNLHAAARKIVSEHGGVFPRDPSKAIALPGIGRYTVHAILSIAYGLPLAAVDGNVFRVISRLSMLSTHTADAIQKEADRLLDPQRPGDANQATMELGATICLPANPACESCPVTALCGARLAGRVSDYPPATARPRVKRERTSVWIVRDGRGRYWLEHRKTAPLAGLWMLPWRGGDAVVEGARLLGSITHAIMNRRYRCGVYETAGGPASIPGAAAGPGEWTAEDRIGSLPHSSLLDKCLGLVRKGRESRKA